MHRHALWSLVVLLSVGDYVTAVAVVSASEAERAQTATLFDGVGPG
ncbi:hypothetical protein [Salinigranum salinum]|nr:hypothetical protein [Salinigranum salinum]